MLGALALANLVALTSCASEPQPFGEDELSTTESTTESGTTESTSELTSTDDSVDSLDSAGVSFYAGPSPDGWGSSECDPFLQDCPDGEKCIPYSSLGGSWDANKCVPVVGDGLPGDPCMGGGKDGAPDDCDESSVCWNVDANLVGVCHAFCTGTADAPICDPGSECNIWGDGSVTLCTPTCDPLVQDCGPELGCFWAGISFLCVPTTSDIPTGDPCGFVNDCAVGNICTDAAALPACAGAACCASFCDLAAPLCPVLGTECVAFFEMGMAPAGLENVGSCQLPG